MISRELIGMRIPPSPPDFIDFIEFLLISKENPRKNLPTVTLHLYFRVRTARFGAKVLKRQAVVASARGGRPNLHQGIRPRRKCDKGV